MPNFVPPVRRRARRQREYHRDLSKNMPFAWVTIAMGGVSIAVYAAMVASGVDAINPGIEDLLAWGADYGPTTLSGQWWRLLTCTFVHIGLFHLAINLWCLLISGTFLERLLGHGTFLWIYLFSALAGSVTSIAWQPDLVSAGASGAVFGVLGGIFACFTALRGAIPANNFLDVRTSVAAFVLYNIFTGLTDPATDNAAHLGGLLGGFLATKLVCRAAVSDDSPNVRLMRADWRMAPVALVLLAIAIVAVRTGSNPAVEAERLYYSTEKLDAEGDLEGALTAIERAIEIDPNEPAWHTNRSYYLEQLERHDEALESIDRAIELSPSDPDLHNRRGWALGLLDRHEEGIEAFDRALLCDRRFLLAHSNRSVFLAHLGRFEESLASADSTLLIAPNDASAHANRAFALRELGRDAEAKLAIEQTLTCDPTHEWAREMLIELAAEDK